MCRFRTAENQKGEPMKYDFIEDAFHFVSGAAPYERSAVVNRVTGETYFASLLTDYSEMPEDVEDNDDYIDIPHKNDLDLGKSLVMEFVRLRCPEQTGRVNAVFSRRGAYGRYKDLLMGEGLLEEWYAFENEHTREALLAWCRGQGLMIEDSA
jgi:hypothetical protein